MNTRKKSVRTPLYGSNVFLVARFGWSTHRGSLYTCALVNGQASHERSLHKGLSWCVHSRNVIRTWMQDSDYLPAYRICEPAFRWLSAALMCVASSPRPRCFATRSETSTHFNYKTRTNPWGKGEWGGDGRSRIPVPTYCFAQNSRDQLLLIVLFYFFFVLLVKYFDFDIPRCQNQNTIKIFEIT